MTDPEVAAGLISRAAYRASPPANIGRAFAALVRREVRVAWAHRSESLQPLFHAVLIVALVPLTLGAEPGLLTRIGPAAILIAATLSSTLALDRLFRGDFDDGSLEQLALSDLPLPLYVAAKIAVHWLTSAGPVLLAIPLLSAAFALPGDIVIALIAALVPATLLMSLIGAVLAALTVGFRTGAVLLSLLVLPLFVPVVIFAAGSVAAAGAGLPMTAPLLMLAALLAFALVAAPLAAAAGLRIGMS